MNPEDAAKAIQQHLDDAVEVVIKLRAGNSVRLPSPDEGPLEAMDCLRAVRSGLDQIETHLTDLIRRRGSLREEWKAARATHEDAWSEVVGVAAKKGRGATGWGEPAPRERYAEADLKTFAQRVAMRRQESLLDQANDAVDVVSRMYKSMDDLRRDIHLSIRAMSVESALER